MRPSFLPDKFVSQLEMYFVKNGTKCDDDAQLFDEAYRILPNKRAPDF